MTPYRSREQPRAHKAPPTTGIVADMVRQFADVHAFVRELVQNGIDAGATALDVRVERTNDGMASVSVTDDGCGMTMEVIEDALLVLFRSTKDADPTKIGKYGVGFLSVFAIAPSEVTVDTWRDGHALRVRLFPDHTYEIEKAGARDESGTTVTLWKPLPAEEFGPFWQKVAASLHRWCRHAEVPITFTVRDEGDRIQERTARADTPFDVRAVISVRQRYDDMEIVVGPIAGSGALPLTGGGEDDPSPFAGFYNRGLTLHETTEPLRDLLSHVRVKVNSSRLLHTLSRDDVRRDQAFHLALARAVELSSARLREAVLRELAKEAEAAALSIEPDPRSEGTSSGAKTADVAPAQRLVDLLEIATLAPISAKLTELVVPLAHPIDGARSMTVAHVQKLRRERLPGRPRVLLATTARTDLTAALASSGVPVVLVARTAVKDAIEHVGGPSLSVAPVAGECLFVRETRVERLPGDDALCAALTEALAETGIDRVTIGRFSEGDDRLGALVPSPVPGAPAHVVLQRDARLSGKWPEGALLVLREDAEPVVSARRAASPMIAAHLLARFLLLAGPGLSSATNHRLTALALAEIR